MVDHICAMEWRFYFLQWISGDELLSDSFPYKEIENGMLWEVEGKVGTFLFSPFKA